MSSLHLAHRISKNSHGLISRHFSRGVIPTTASVEFGGYKVMGMPHLSHTKHYVVILKTVNRNSDELDEMGI